jgi:hypothetical protein
MHRLNELTQAHLARRDRNLSLLRARAVALDEPLLNVSDPVPSMMRSQASEPVTQQSDLADEIRRMLPRRSTPGGPFGDSILGRVVAGYVGERE